MVVGSKLFFGKAIGGGEIVNRFSARALASSSISRHRFLLSDMGGPPCLRFFFFLGWPLRPFPPLAIRVSKN
jgi:hypothetical protein